MVEWWNKLPQAVQEVIFLLFVGVVSAAAAAARMLLGKDAVGARAFIGGLMVAGFTAAMVAGFLADKSPLSVNFGAALASMVGLFTNEFLKLAQGWIKARVNLDSKK